MGADRSRVFFITGARIAGEVQPFDPARDMPMLLAQAEVVGDVRLLIVDPVVSAVLGDSHKNTEVRRAMQPLVDLGAALDCAVLGISHFSKGGAGSDPASRVVGSIAFTAVARVVLVAAKVKSEDGSDRRILARGKSNVGPDDGGFEYHIEQSEPLPDIHASYIAWGDAVAGSARDLLTDPNEQDEDEKSAVDAAADFVRQVLADGLTPSNTVKTEAASAGVSWASVRRAADVMSVIKSKGTAESGGAWYWKLPHEKAQLAQLAQQINVEHLEQQLEQVTQSDQLAQQHDQEVQRSQVEQVEQVEQVTPNSEIF
ncbi:AAA family ATPase [Roseateles sp. GG27B]